MDIVQTLIVIAVFGIVIYSNIKSENKKKTNRQTPPPYIPTEIPDEVMQESVREVVQPSGATERHVSESVRKPVSGKVSSVSKPSATVGSASLVRLDSVEEARRAFIYSEIFRRKYE